MSRFTPLQLTLLCLFCLYWFIFFPIIWFVVRPAIFVSDIWQALLFAIFLFVIYCVLHLLVLIVFELCEQPNKRATLISNGGQQLPSPPDAVIYHTKPCAGHGDGDTKDSELRFVSSFELFYDGKKFRDSTVV